MRFLRNLSTLVAFFLICVYTPTASAVPMVWTGLTKSFTKASGADPTDPLNWDYITPSVALMRGNTQGMYNALTEASYTHLSSPDDTEWATQLTTSETISATNWSALQADGAFDDWETAYGSVGSLASNIVSFPAVVHLISDDIYLDLQFTDWGQGGGMFNSEVTYLRSVPEPATVTLWALGFLGCAGLYRRRRARRS